MKVCSFEGCNTQSQAKGLCPAHYSQRSRGKELTPLRYRSDRKGRRGCSFVGCDKDHKVRGLCQGHALQLKQGKKLTPLLRYRRKPKDMDIEEWFWMHVEKGPGTTCWLWQGTVTANGYGIFQTNRQRYLAHRYSFELAKRPVPEDARIKRSCVRPSCVNPNHLFLEYMSEVEVW